MRRALPFLFLLACTPTQRPEVECVGVVPPDSAWEAEAGPLWDGDPVTGDPVLGEPAPSWALPDVQPRSCGYEATYGLDLFRGQVLLVAALAGG